MDIGRKGYRSDIAQTFQEKKKIAVFVCARIYMMDSRRNEVVDGFYRI